MIIIISSNTFYASRYVNMFVYQALQIHGAYGYTYAHVEKGEGERERERESKEVKKERIDR